MSRKLKRHARLKVHPWGVLASATLLSACATEPTYSPPEGPRASESCPIGEVWVCEDHYPSRIDRNEPPLFCRCEDPQFIH